MEGLGLVVGKKAPDFELWSHLSRPVRLYEALKAGPTLLVFYPGDFTPVCTKQLCNYRDNLAEFAKFGLQILGVSKNSVAQHVEFAEKYGFPFPLLSDPGSQVARAFGCTTFLMLGRPSRAVFILNRQGMVLYRYVEPTSLTRRGAEELVKVCGDLKQHGLLE